jgi:hypothetical protein
LHMLQIAIVHGKGRTIGEPSRYQALLLEDSVETLSVGLNFKEGHHDESKPTERQNT